MSQSVDAWEFEDRDKLKLIIGIDETDAWLSSDTWVDARDSR